MSFSLTRRRFFLTTIIALSLLLANLLPAPAAKAEEQLTINKISVDRQNVYPGETVRATISWTNKTGYDVAATLRCKGGSTVYEQPLSLGNSGSTRIDLPVEMNAARNAYAISITSGGRELNRLDGAFTVNEIVVGVSSVTPSEALPVEVLAGNTLRVSFRYTSPADTKASISIGGIASKTIDLDRAAGSKGASADLPIPASAPAGNYNLNMSFQGSAVKILESRAVKVKAKPVATLNITSPTKGTPTAVRPGSNITVKYNYSVSDDTPVLIQMVAGNSVPVSREATLNKNNSSGSIVITMPSTVPEGKYSLVIQPKTGAGALDTESEAVLIENRVTADIVSPTRSKPLSVAGGEKATISFDYTADINSTVLLRLQQSDSQVLLSSNVNLDRTAVPKRKTVTVTIPGSVSGGKYDLVIKSPVSGNTLDIERDAVIVDARVTAGIISPTRSDAASVRAGGALQVKFSYTSNAEGDVDVKVLKKDGSALATAGASIDKSTTKKNRTVTVNIPSGASPGKYDLAVTSKYSGKVLDSEIQAVVVEDPVKLKIVSPTKGSPVRLDTDGKVAVKFTYTAQTANDVEFRLLKPDGKTLVKSTQRLSRATSSKTEYAELKLPAGTPAAGYDLEVVNRDTGNPLALENRAVTVVSYPVGIQVKFVVGQSGRWVNGTFQSTDMGIRIIQSRTMLPIRHLGEPLGWDLEWDETSKMATVIKGDNHVRVWVDKNTGQISANGGRTWKTMKIDSDNPQVQPLLISGRVLLPLRFVSEALDTGVTWDGTSQTVLVSQE